MVDVPPLRRCRAWIRWAACAVPLVRSLFFTMGFNLTHDERRVFGFSNAGWRFYRALAETYGWQPAGTLPPPGFTPAASWPATYESNDGQWVSAEDALALAAALRRALEDPARATHERKIAEGLDMDAPRDDSGSLGEMIKFFEFGRFQLL